MKHISLLGILGMAAIFVPKALLAQSVTWGATGLPPGMSIVSVNGTAANITGTPSVPGTYNPVVFPKIGNAAGNMASFRLTVLPSGMDLPTYYYYDRTGPNGDYLNALAGGNGTILLSSWPSKKLYFTTNGTNFAEGAIQSGAPNGYVKAAEFAGFRCVVKFENPGSLYYSDNRTAFKPLDFPSDLSDPDYAQFVSNRSNRFFLISGSTIWSLQNNQNTWKSGSLPFSGFYSASMAANGNLLVLACAYNDDPVGLCYSTNAGDTWIQSPNNPGIIRVIYGNGIFLGSGISGVWKSTNGIDWQKVSSLSNVSNLAFSAPENLFLSNLGVSKDGLYWVGYNGGDSYGNIVSSGTGVIFSGSRQLSLTKIPSFWDNKPKKATANKPASFRIQVSQ